jgi:hypothetical protein
MGYETHRVTKTQCIAILLLAGYSRATASKMVHNNSLFVLSRNKETGKMKVTLHSNNTKRSADITITDNSDIVRAALQTWMCGE